MRRVSRSRNEYNSAWHAAAAAAIRRNANMSCKVIAGHVRIHDAALERALETLAVALLPLAINNPDEA